jgi:hypothetical protein
VHEGSVTLYGKDYRAVVVHSSAHDQRRQKRLQRELRVSRGQIEQAARSGAQKTFFCRPDAEAAAAAVRSCTRAYHQLHVRVEERPRYGPGRPKKGAPRIPVAIDYVLRSEIGEKREEIEKRRQLAGCFVLLSNVSDPQQGGYSAERILRTYKEQNAIEKNFGFLKDDQIVNALFLKRPERVEALGLILLISLLIWRLIELVMRTELQAREATLPGWDNKPTARPTAYMVTWKFKGILILCVNGRRLLAKPLTDTQHAFLQALQVPASCFTRHPRDGWAPVKIPEIHHPRVRNVRRSLFGPGISTRAERRRTDEPPQQAFAAGEPRAGAPPLHLRCHTQTRRNQRRRYRPRRRGAGPAGRVLLEGHAGRVCQPSGASGTRGRLEARIAKLKGRYDVTDYAALLRRMDDEDLDQLFVVARRQLELEERVEPPDPSDSAAAARIKARYL